MPEDETPSVPELTPLAGEERALVKNTPCPKTSQIPKGVPNAEVNKNLLGAALDVSTATIDKCLSTYASKMLHFGVSITAIGIG
jgi:hypothetical protein